MAHSIKVLTYTLVLYFANVYGASVVNYYNWNFMSANTGLKTPLDPKNSPPFPQVSIVMPGMVQATGIDSVPSQTYQPAIECKPPVITPAPSGIYWRDFHGPPVPEDAIVAGYEKTNGKLVPVFIGQAHFGIEGSGLQPVAIYNDSRPAVNTYKTFKTTDKNIKILCASSKPENNDELLKWVTAAATEDHADVDLLAAGYENGYTVFFGRAAFRSNFVVGKAVRKSWGFRLYFPIDGEEEHVDDRIEILVHSKPFLSEVDEDVSLGRR